MSTISPLEQARTDRGWSRARVEALTNGLVTPSSLKRWETKGGHPRMESLETLCTLFGKTPEELGFSPSHAIMGPTENVLTLQGGFPMTNVLRRAMFGSLGLRLSNLIDLWPRRDYHYEELQGEINRMVMNYNTIVEADSTYEYTRRQALRDVALMPLELVGGLALLEAGKIQKVDNNILLKNIAAGLAACWYLRRGKDLAFVSDLTSTYIALLQPLTCSRSETYQRASATLLSQCFILKSKLTSALHEDDQAIIYEKEAIHYAEMAESSTEQAIANREMALLHWRRKNYKQALTSAEAAYGLAREDKATPKLILSFTASGLSFCQASSGQVKEAQISLKEAHDLFDPAAPMALVPYGRASLSSIDADIYRHTGNFKEAISIYKQYSTMPNISSIGKVENCIDYAQTEVSRDDKERDMGLCVSQLTEGITGARELGSRWYIREARECYNLLRVAWPREETVKRLGREHFGA